MTLPEIERIKRCLGAPTDDHKVHADNEAMRGDIRTLLDCVGVLWAALEWYLGDDREPWNRRARTALSDARKILGSEQEGGAG